MVSGKQRSCTRGVDVLVSILQAGFVLAKVHSCAIVGLEGEIIDVEVDIARGLPSFTIVGLPDAAVKESRERVWQRCRTLVLCFRANATLVIL